MSMTMRAVFFGTILKSMALKTASKTSERGIAEPHRSGLSGAALAGRARVLAGPAIYLKNAPSMRLAQRPSQITASVPTKRTDADVGAAAAGSLDTSRRLATPCADPHPPDRHDEDP